MIYKKLFKISCSRVRDFRKIITFKVKSKRNNACHVTYSVPLTEAFHHLSFAETQGMIEFSYFAEAKEILCCEQRQRKGCWSHTHMQTLQYL